MDGNERSLKWHGSYNKILRITNQDRTKNNGFKIKKRMFKKDIRNIWLNGTDSAVRLLMLRQQRDVKTTKSFKRRLDKYMNENDR